jgi:hypothetical protein
MGEGLSPFEVGKELGEHAKHSGEHAEEKPHAHPDRWVSIAEAVLLSVVTIIAAWSGFSAAKWSTESSLTLAQASATRAQANRAFQESLTLRNVDATTFNAWYEAYVNRDANAMRVAVKRFRPAYAYAFEAWLATHPFTNLGAPRGPQDMPEYKTPRADQATALDHEAEALYVEGQHAGETGDDYVRTTVILASVLFLVGISSHFPVRGVRLGLIGLGTVLLLFGVIEILTLPAPP